MKTSLLLALLIIPVCLKAQINTSLNKQNTMKVAVWDTYVPRKDGRIMHFDIIAPESIKDTAVIHEYGMAYLKTKGQEGQPLTAKECRFCHVRQVHPTWQTDIDRQGYYILEMENCD